MFNFYVVLASRDTAWLPHRAGENSKPHHYKKSTKTERLSENMGFNGKSLKNSDEKKRTETLFSTFHKIPGGTAGP